MSQLNLPPIEVKTTQKDGNTYIFDFLRQRYIRLTPEEWVRQHFTHYLVESKGYPKALLANEVTIQVGGVSRRCDSVLYDKYGCAPVLLWNTRRLTSPSHRKFSSKFIPTTAYFALNTSSSATESPTIVVT